MLRSATNVTLCILSNQELKPLNF